jgi:hypothetical protein
VLQSVDQVSQYGMETSNQSSQVQRFAHQIAHDCGQLDGDEHRIVWHRLYHQVAKLPDLHAQLGQMRLNHQLKYHRR